MCLLVSFKPVCFKSQFPACLTSFVLATVHLRVLNVARSAASVTNFTSCDVIAGCSSRALYTHFVYKVMVSCSRTVVKERKSLAAAKAGTHIFVVPVFRCWHFLERPHRRIHFEAISYSVGLK